uniref:Uncharacterized protein n=1 Tax=Plectus sambesii TaxID=2011161 RepID=A0A914X2U7_9BILA
MDDDADWEFGCIFAAGDASGRSPREERRGADTRDDRPADRNEIYSGLLLCPSRLCTPPPPSPSNKPSRQMSPLYAANDSIRFQSTNLRSTNPTLRSLINRSKKEERETRNPSPPLAATTCSEDAHSNRDFFASKATNAEAGVIIRRGGGCCCLTPNTCGAHKWAAAM